MLDGVRKLAHPKTHYFVKRRAESVITTVDARGSKDTRGRDILFVQDRAWQPVVMIGFGYLKDSTGRLRRVSWRQPASAMWRCRDTVPYERFGPNTEIVAKQITALAKLTLSSRKEGIALWKP